jgi:predicted RNA-binding protein with PIN domain
MAYLIDGHNLIPKISGLSLRAMDDETQLILLLQDFCRKKRKKVEVYFDQAPAGQAQSQRFGMVLAHFVREGTTADQAIANRLRRLGRLAANWTVVSSDHAVQNYARSQRAKVISSEAFAAMLGEKSGQVELDPWENKRAGLRADEVEEWMNLFRKKGNDS